MGWLPLRAKGLLSAGNVALLCRASLCYGLAALACERAADPVLVGGIAETGLAVLWAG